MALQAESAHVAEVAFAAAFDDRDDVVGIPERFAAFESPSGDGFLARATTETANVGVLGHAICSAFGADPFIAFEDAVAQMTGITAKTPFFHAEGGAEGLTASGDFELAPTAEATAVWTFG